MFERSFEKQDIEKMSVSHTDKVAPQLFEFIDRAQAGLPEHFPANGIAVAGPDLLCALEAFPESYDSWGYRRSTDGDAYERPSPLVNGSLEVQRDGEFWYMLRTVEDAKGGD